MLVVIKSAKGRHVFVGTDKLSEKHWSQHSITPDIIKGIKNGDIVEATDKQVEAALQKDEITDPPAGGEEERRPRK